MTVKPPVESTTDPAWRLTSEQIETYFRDGFLGPLPRFAPTELLTAAAELCIQVERDRPPHPLFGRFSVRELHLIDESVRSLVTHPAITTPLTQLFNNNLVLWRTTAFVKPPHTGPLMWHQDDGFYRGLEYGNDIVALAPNVQPGVSSECDVAPDQRWDINVWIALTEVTAEMGALRMIRGSQHRLLPNAQVPLPEAVFFDPSFSTINDVDTLVRAARDGTLVIDVDTTSFFDNIDVAALTLAEAKAIAVDRLSRMTGEIMLPFEIDEERLVHLPMKQGEFLIFTERVVHSSDANTSDRPRVGMACRVTNGETLVYPGRARGQYKDGSNIDIRRHYCLRLHGDAFHPDNQYEPPLTER